MSEQFPVALMSKDDRVMHLPGHEHGVAACGEHMRDEWMGGPFEVISDKAEHICERCFDRA
jgi:hypothetical protein